MFAVLAMLVVIGTLSVRAYSPAPSQFVIPQTLRVANWPGAPQATLADIAADADSGDAWCRALGLQDGDPPLDPERIGIASMTGSMQLGRTLQHGWATNWLIVSCGPAPNAGDRVIDGPATEFAYFMNRRFAYQLSVPKMLGRPWLISFSVFNFLAAITAGVLIVRGVLKLRPRSASRRGVRRLVLVAGLALALIATAIPWSVSRSYSGTYYSVESLTLADVQAWQGRADGDARLAAAIIAPWLAKSTRARSVVLVRSLEGGQPGRIWRYGSPWPLWSTADVRLVNPDRYSVSAYAPRAFSLSNLGDAGWMFWLPAFGDSGYRQGISLNVSTLLGLLGLAWVIYRVVSTICYGYEPWRRRRWVRQGLCHACGYDRQ